MGAVLWVVLMAVVVAANLRYDPKDPKNIPPCDYNHCESCPFPCPGNRHEIRKEEGPCVMGRRGKHSKKPTEFSKKILIFAALVNAVVIAFTMAMIWRTCDLTPLAYLIPAVAAETATGTGFYYAKAKVENRIKLMRQNKVEPTENAFNDAGGYL